MTTAGSVAMAPAKSAAGEKKSRPAKKATKTSSPKSSSPAHPPYFQMIKEAILGLKERTGSSSYAIAKYMEEHHKGVLPSNFKKILGTQLKNLAAKGKLVKVKASFKLSESSKTAPKPKAVKKTPAKKKAEKKPKEKKAVSAKAAVGGKRKATAVASAMAKKKSVAAASQKKVKKVMPAKPKQPKSIKSPGAKKVKKVGA